MEQIKYNHREAFCHMKYQGKHARKVITVLIWNSRDGVTPFITYSKEFGMELQHVEFNNDYTQPEFKPKKGDLIWRDMTDDEIKDMATNQFNSFVDDLAALKLLSEEEIKAKSKYDRRPQLESIIGEGLENWITMTKQSTPKGSPKLELVKEDWL